MNLATMLGLVRRDLHDEDVQSYRWIDSELERHISRAVSEFSRACPKEEKATIATTNGSRDISVASLSGVVGILAVEYPVDKFPRRFQRFSLYQNTITLLGTDDPDGANCYVYYGQLHTLDSQSSTVPSRYEDLVAAGAAAYAALEWAIYAVDRVNAGGAQVPADFDRWARERGEYFKAELKKLKSRVRSGVLYSS